ncbi:MAG: hypothetical protein WA880_10155 [Ornithinimicrobium sp.]
MRRGALKVLASPYAGQGLARRIYPDLVSRSEMSAAVSTAQTKAAAQSARARAQHRRDMTRVTAEHVLARKALKAEHEHKMTAERDRLRDKRAAALAAERQKGREARDRAVAAQRREEKEKRTQALAEARQRWNHKRRKEQKSRLAISPGFLIAGESLADRPLIVCDVRGLTGDIADDVVDEVATEQVLGCGFRVLFVTDLEDAGVLRRYGHLVEVIHTLPDGDFSMSTTDYAAERIEIIRKHYDARWLLRVGSHGLSAEQRAHLQKFGY